MDKCLLPIAVCCFSLQVKRSVFVKNIYNSLDLKLRIQQFVLVSVLFAPQISWNHGNAQTICKDVVYQYPNASKMLVVSSCIRKFRSVTFSHVASPCRFAMTPVKMIAFDRKKYLSASWSVYRILNSLDRQNIRDLIFWFVFCFIYRTIHRTIHLVIEAKHHTEWLIIFFARPNNTVFIAQKPRLQYANESGPNDFVFNEQIAPKFSCTNLSKQSSLAKSLQVFFLFVDRNPSIGLSQEPIRSWGSAYSIFNGTVCCRCGIEAMQSFIL